MRYELGSEEPKQISKCSFEILHADITSPEDISRVTFWPGVTAGAETLPTCALLLLQRHAK